MKRIWLNLTIFVGCFVLLITILGAVLIMAPGMELLGVMYIRSTSGSVNQNTKVTDATAYKQIYVESDNIPVYIEFVQSYNLSATLIEEYNGFAKAGGTPSVSVDVTTKGVEIKSHEYESFLFNSRSEESGLIVKVPLYYKQKLVIKSNKSKIVFTGLEASISDIFVTTKGVVEFNNNLSFKNLELTLGNKDAVVSNNVLINGYIIAKSNRGDVTLPDGFDGNVAMETNSGNLILASCGDLNFKSKTGSIKPNGDNIPTVLGDASIETNGDVMLKSVGGKCSINAKNGDISLGHDGNVSDRQVTVTTSAGKINLLGEYTNEKNVIKTKSGSITAGSLKNHKVESKYGSINIKKADNISVTTKSGNVKINNVLSNTTVSTNNGDVTLGADENSVVLNATIATVGGDVKINSASGEGYNIKTTSGDIKFKQKSGTKINLNIDSKRGDINLINLCGAVNASTKGEVVADIVKMGGYVNIAGNNRKVSITVHDTCYLDLSSKKNIESAPGLEEKCKTFVTVPVSGNHEDSTIKVATKKGIIAISKV